MAIVVYMICTQTIEQQQQQKHITKKNNNWTSEEGCSDYTHTHMTSKCRISEQMPIGVVVKTNRSQKHIKSSLT